MTRIDKFQIGLYELELLMVELEALCDCPSPPPKAELGEARWAVVRALAKVAAFHEKFLLAPLEASGDAAKLATAQSTVAAMQVGMQKLVMHSQCWPAEAVQKDWPGFNRARAEAYHIIREHFSLEARVIPPILAALNGASSAPNRNWTRPIWAVQAAFLRP